MSRAQRSSLSSRDFLIFLGICVAALSAAVVWLATSTRQPRQDTAALRTRVALLEQRLGEAQQTANALAARTAAQLELQAAELKKLGAQSPGLASRCLTEVQQEIDDIRGYIAFGGGIRRRVSAECTTLLRPRFGG